MAETHIVGPLAGYPLTPGYQSQTYYSTPASFVTTNAPTLNALRLVPYPVGVRNRFDRIAVEVTGLVASSFVRLGIYGPDENVDFIGKLILDAGQVSGGAVGAPEIVINLTLDPGMYWLGAVCQGAGAATLRSIQVLDAINLPITTGTMRACGYEMTGVSGALPGSVAVSATPAQIVPRIYLRDA